MNLPSNDFAYPALQATAGEVQVKQRPDLHLAVDQGHRPKFDKEERKKEKFGRATPLKYLQCLVTLLQEMAHLSHRCGNAQFSTHFTASCLEQPPLWGTYGSTASECSVHVACNSRIAAVHASRQPREALGNAPTPDTPGLALIGEKLCADGGFESVIGS